jgi:hypothetical protein
VTDLIGVFLVKRYDEAEAVAKAGVPGRAAYVAWYLSMYHFGAGNEAQRECAARTWEQSGSAGDDRWQRSWEAAASAVGDDLDAKLRDIAAKRAIVALHGAKVTKRDQFRYDSSTGEPIPDEYDGDCEACGWFAPDDGGCLTVRHLAGEFSCHPECRPGWVPESSERGVGEGG